MLKWISIVVLHIVGVCLVYAIIIPRFFPTYKAYVPLIVAALSATIFGAVIGYGAFKTESGGGFLGGILGAIFSPICMLVIAVPIIIWTRGS